MKLTLPDLFWLTVFCISVPSLAAEARTVTFDFDTGVPALVPGQNLPFDQAVDNITAHFSSLSDSSREGSFSVQDAGSTGYRLSRFSGRYLYPNSVNRITLDIAFDRPISGLALNFATSDFHQAEVPTTVQLSTYMGSTDNPPIGTRLSGGVYPSDTVLTGDTMPQGTIAFDAGGPSFDRARISIPDQPLAATDFLIDDIVVTADLPGSVAGDLNGDGIIDVRDASLALQIAVGLRAASPAELAAGDVWPSPGLGGLPYGDGRINLADVIWILHRALGLVLSG